MDLNTASSWLRILCSAGFACFFIDALFVFICRLIFDNTAEHKVLNTIMEIISIILALPTIAAVGAIVVYGYMLR